MTARPERSMAAPSVKTAPVRPVPTVKYQFPSAVAIGSGAGVAAPFTLVANAQTVAGKSTRKPPKRA